MDTIKVRILTQSFLSILLIWAEEGRRGEKKSSSHPASARSRRWLTSSLSRTLSVERGQLRLRDHPGR